MATMADGNVVETEADVHAEEKRERILTKRGLEYALKIKKNRLSQLSSSLEKSLSTTFDLLDKDADENEVKQDYKKWLFLYDQFLDIDEQYRLLLEQSDSSVEEYEQHWFAPRDMIMRDFKSTVEQWFQKRMQAKLEKSSDRNSISTRTSTRSSISKHSKKTDHSVTSSNERRIALTIKAENLKKRKALEQQKLELKMKEEELKLQEELAILDATSKFHDNESTVFSIKSKHVETVPKPSSSNDHKVVTSVVQHLSRPASTLEKFSGDPMTYHRFIRQFKCKVESNTDDKEACLNFLEQYTSGDARKIVIGYSYSTNGYCLALKELERRYGDPEILVNAFVKKALSWSQIKPDEPKELDSYALFLSECQNAVQSLHALKVLEYSDNFKKIVEKLPYFLQDRWRGVVYNLKEHHKPITFNELVTFIRMEAQKANDPMFGRDAMKKKPEKKPERRQSSHVTKGSFVTTVKPSAYTSPCCHCDESHSLDSCPVVYALPFYDRINVLKYKGFCFGCLKRGHQRNECRNKATCSHCKGRHPSILHVDGRISPRPNIAQGVSSSQAEVHTGVISSVIQGHHARAGDGEVTMAIIPVKVGLSGSTRMINRYAFLDPGSNASFISDNLMHQLGLQGKRMKLSMDTMGEKHTMITHEVRNVVVCDVAQTHTVNLPALYSKDGIPVAKRQIPSTEDIAVWPHLGGITLPQVSADVGLLLGNNVPDAYSPYEVRVGPSGSPYASRTRLGWIAWNVIRPGRDGHHISANRADVQTVELSEELRSLEITYQKSVAIDFQERDQSPEKREHSIEDKRFLKKMADSKEIVDGHYQFCLPFKDKFSSLPDNKNMALCRLHSLKKKLTNNDKFSQDYKQFMSTLLERGFAEEVSEDECTQTTGRTWYLPHHGIYHHRKNKIRIVFDCSAKYLGMCLNDVLLTGPDLTNNLTSVLLRFRTEAVAITSDIEKMFYQVKVQKEDRDFLRFYWWRDGDVLREPTTYRMTVHLFGAASSPSVASYALQQTVVDNREYFDQTIINTMKSSFYVDDFLYSVPSEEDAIHVYQEVTGFCELGGFILTKWVSNRQHVLEAIPEEDRSASVKDLSQDSRVTERALGVSWHLDTDTLSFLHGEAQNPTRRSILSLVSSVYDPLGLVAPLILPAKILLQDLCRDKVEWDAELSGIHLQKWFRWLEQFKRLSEVEVPRCIKPHDFGKISSVQIHHFSDASELGYGVATYIRVTNKHGMVNCTLLFSRSRVAPLRKVTIPRMELTAATVAIRISQMINQQLGLEAKHNFWTDSMSVIRYVANETTRFYTFVANRVSLIRENSSLDQWKFIESSKNPADLASRGMGVDELLQNEMWLKGPSFLRQPEDEWPEQPDGVLVLPSGDPEVKAVVSAAIVELVPETHLLDNLIARFSSVMKLRTTVGWVLYFIKCLKLRTSCASVKDDGPVIHRILPYQMLHQADFVLWKHVQNRYFSKEIAMLADSKSVSPSSHLYKLDPFLEHGIIRVGGRLRHASIPHAVKHQILLPRESQLTSLILSDIHKRTGHQGKNVMLAELRQQYWISRAVSVIKSITSKCVTCRRYRSRPEVQKMADLPSDRITADKPPFSSTGMDYFGPFEVKYGRKTIKRYGVIFTCSTSRAIHLEIAASLTTDSCINSIRRFLARRGPVELIRSDNGTNIVGAEAELRRELSKWNQSQIGRMLQQENVKWIFNTPAASHFGGFWERLIRSVRKVLYGLLRDRSITPDDESLHTVMCEVEQILNNRPLTTATNDPNDLEVITPNHLLMTKSNISLPPGLFSSSDNYVRRRWRQAQHFTNLFWSRWSREYLPALQVRQKWFKVQRNLMIGDICIIKDNTPRCCWLLGRVVSVVKDCHNIVRSVSVKTRTSVFDRPVDKLVLLLEGDE